MICQPCEVDDHDNCTPAIGAASLGIQDECLCWRYGEVHFIWAKPTPRVKGEHDGWTDEEIRDHQHDTGEDEFDTWIARGEREREEEMA